MTIGEMRHLLAGVNFAIPVLYFDGVKYNEVIARWQNHVHENLSRDVTISEATQGHGISAIVIEVKK